MNRKTKGALAIGAGAIILIGGAGSYALWSDSDIVAGGEIQTGFLGIECPDDSAGATWTDVSPTMIGGSVIDPATDRMVPGDVWEYNANCTVQLEGKNLLATLAITPGTTTLPADVSTALFIDDQDVTTTPTPVEAGDDIDVTVRVTFDIDAEGSMEQQIDLDGMGLTLTQTRPS